MAQLNNVVITKVSDTEFGKTKAGKPYKKCQFWINDPHWANDPFDYFLDDDKPKPYEGMELLTLKYGERDFRNKTYYNANEIEGQSKPPPSPKPKPQPKTDTKDDYIPMGFCGRWATDIVCKRVEFMSSSKRDSFGAHKMSEIAVEIAKDMHKKFNEPASDPDFEDDIPY